MVPQSPEAGAHVLKSLTTRSNLNLNLLVFIEGGKPEDPEKKLSEQRDNQQKPQPT